MTQDPTMLAATIKAEARRLGFFACGISRAEAVDPATARAYRDWIACGCHASMAYLANNIDKRLDPLLLMPGVQSIVSVAFSYAPSAAIAPSRPQIAKYALGADYHDFMRIRLHALAAAVGFGRDAYRAFCDTAPVLERYWAVRSGIGWVGRNRQLIIPGAGSMFFLGELFLPVALPPDAPVPSRCGNCTACLRACPTGALCESVASAVSPASASACAPSAPVGGGNMPSTSPFGDAYGVTFDSRRCLSYLTIEHRGDIPPSLASCLGNTIYGCDRCLDACPHNRRAVPNDSPELRPREELLSMTRDRWLLLDEDSYRRLFKGSAVKRAKYNGLMRNIRAALGAPDSPSDTSPTQP